RDPSHGPGYPPDEIGTLRSERVDDPRPGDERDDQATVHQGLPRTHHPAPDGVRRPALEAAVLDDDRWPVGDAEHEDPEQDEAEPRRERDAEARQRDEETESDDPDAFALLGH